ncbi:limonene-1,2-epoxide hydrolase family protein [Nocardia stercoris]|uniref:Limonene-1,2-epoxide hydrolase n=1 Tax=Nocardia stercoris TaxID=2483361 RepID=A0A3M2LFX9_9NOCA|nr:limonene-1,2-epoxide hydrolase family protein [Nocardia stercoris]RMI35730.1 limonene-1,2-epoxide hydrolase [Nocardia stercoris]
MSPEELVTEFCARWRDAAPEQLAEYFTEDAVYHNIPMEPVAGKAAITEFLRGFIGAFGGIEFDIHHQYVSGNVVFNERTDRFTLNGKRIELPVAGVFEVADGRIAAWRDYFDMTVISNSMQ